MKELTPPEVVQAILDGERVEVRGAISSCNGEWELLNEHQTYIRLLTNGFFEFRLAQEVITIGEVSFPKPVSEPLEAGTEYWVAKLNYLHYVVDSSYTWCDDTYDNLYLKRGLIHLTKENAIEHSKALIQLSGGNPDDLF